MEPRTLTFRKPWLFRAVSVLVMLICYADVFGIWNDMAKHHSMNYGALLFFILWFGGGSVVFFWLSGPNDIYFDLQQRTYRYVKGWPFFPKTRTGSLSDFWGVYTGRKRSSFCVGVTWWGGGNVTLESFSDKMKAEQFAATLRAMLELKQIMPPRNLRPSA